MTSLPSNDDDDAVVAAAGQPTSFDRTELLEPHTKITIRFKAIGRAPILRQREYKINSNEKFERVKIFLRRQLGVKASDELVILDKTFMT